MQNKYIAEYCPINSMVHKINAAIKVVVLIFYTVLILVISDKLMLGICGLFTGVLILASNVPVKFYFKIIFTFIYFYLFLALVLALFGMDIISISLVILKIILFILNLMMIIHTTPTDDIVIGVTKLFNIFNFSKFNLNKWGIRTYQVLKLIPTIYKTTNQILNSQASRGIDYKYTTIIGKWIAILSCITRVFAVTKEKIINLGIVMEQRLFSLSENTRKINFKNLQMLDYVYMGMFFLVIFFYVMRVK